MELINEESVDLEVEENQLDGQNKEETVPNTNASGGNLFKGYSFDTKKLRNILFFDPELTNMEVYSRVNDIEMEPNGSNLPSVLNHLCKEEEQKEKNIRYNEVFARK